MVYGMIPFTAGAKNGPDPHFLGKKTYDLSAWVKTGVENELLVITESLGQNRTPVGLNDIRNKRGIISAKFSPLVAEPQWWISGIDVRTLDDPFNTSGLPGEQAGRQRGEGPGWIAVDAPNIAPDDGLVWYKATFEWGGSPTQEFPIRVRCEGKQAAFLFVNGIFIGRYAGDWGPQTSFYIMEGLLSPGPNQLVVAMYSGHATEARFDVVPYFVDPVSGNLDEAGGVLFTTLREAIPPGNP
jgi:hypothetical protein